MPEAARPSAILGLIERLAQARAIGSHTLFTTYTTGTTPGNPHWSWVPTYLNDVMLDWLFEQDLQNRTPISGAALLSAAR